MLERFPARLALANKGPSDVSDRQRTMRATIAWSYGLLGSEAQRLFTCLGVFAGGVSVAAAESVCAALGLRIDTVECLESLVDQSLLRRIRGAGDAPRYRMLETIREYALEKLAEHGQDQAARQAHAGYFLNLVESADLQGHGQTHWLHTLAADHDNFRAALHWCREQGRIDMGLRLSVALMPLWQLRDHQLEARAWLHAFMANEGTVSPDTWANGLLWQGLLLMRGTGDTASAAPFFDEALVLFRRQENLVGAIEALQAQGDMYRLLEAWEQARKWYGESLELARQSNHAHLAAHGYMGLAYCAQEDGEFAEAQHHWASTLEWAQLSGNRGTIAMSLNSLGEMARYQKDWVQARNSYEQTLRIAEELGSEFWKALALHNLGYVALHSGESVRAKEVFTDSLRLYARQQHRKGVAECLAGLGKVEASGDGMLRAARLCGASEAILQGLRMRLDALDRADYLETLEVLRCELGDRSGRAP